MSETQIIRDLAVVVQVLAGTHKYRPTAFDLDGWARGELTEDQRAALNAATGQNFGGSETWEGDHPTSIYFRDLTLWEDGAPPCGAPSGEHDDGVPMVCLRPEDHEGDHWCGEFTFTADWVCTDPIDRCNPESDHGSGGCGWVRTGDSR